MIDIVLVDSLMLSIYERIKSGLYYDNNLNKYSLGDMNYLLEYFLKIEDYDKCECIKNVIKKRFDHDNADNFYER